MPTPLSLVTTLSLGIVPSAEFNSINDKEYLAGAGSSNNI
jgi:hypothetical protein